MLSIIIKEQCNAAGLGEGMVDEITPVIYGLYLIGRDDIKGSFGLSYEGGAELMFRGS